MPLLKQQKDEMWRQNSAVITFGNKTTDSVRCVQSSDVLNVTLKIKNKTKQKNKNKTQTKKQTKKNSFALHYFYAFHLIIITLC